MPKTVTGVFSSKNQAEKAIEELHDQGFTKDEISVVTKDEGRGRKGGGRGDMGASDMEIGSQDVSAGVGWGGGIGAAAGLLAGAGALAIPGVGPILAAGPLAAALTGAVTGGIAGGLVDYGIPETRGKDYEKKVKEGGILAVVHASEDKSDRSDKAAEILRRNGARDVETHEGVSAR
jgi:uncharacterized membrane protein